MLQSSKEVKTKTVAGSCAVDEGGPLGIGVQAQVSNRDAAAVLKRHGRERASKSPAYRADVNTEDERKQTVRDAPLFPLSAVETKGVRFSWEEPAGNLDTGRSAAGVEAA